MLTPGEFVISHDMMRRGIGSSGGNTNVYVTVSPFTDPVAVGREVSLALDAYEQRVGIRR